MAATMLQNSSQNCIHNPPFPLRGRYSCASNAPLGLRFPQKRFAAGFDGGRQGVPLARGYILAAFDEFVRAVAKLAGLLLGKFATLIGALAEIFAGLVPGFRSEKDAEQRANAHADQEETDF